MKPFITNAFKNGKYLLNYQIEGITRCKLDNKLLGLDVTHYALPTSQSLKSVWQFYLFFESNSAIEFSSACTGVGGWNEVGSLNIKFIQPIAFDELDKGIYSGQIVEDFEVKRFSSLVYDVDDIYSECGIILTSDSGLEIIVATGCSPGSVTAKMPGAEGFEPEFEYRLMRQKNRIDY